MLLSVQDSIVEMRDPIRKSTLPQQGQIQSNVIRQGSFASSDNHRRHEEMDLVDQPGLQA